MPPFDKDTTLGFSQSSAFGISPLPSEEHLAQDLPLGRLISPTNGQDFCGLLFPRGLVV